MVPANDLRIEVYIRSMTQLMGIEQVKKTVLHCISELENELKRNPEQVLTAPRTLSHGFVEITREHKKNRKDRIRQ